MLFPIGDENIDRGHRPIFSYLLLIANIAVFIFQSSLPEGAQAGFVETYGAIPVEISHGIDLHTLLSSIFLHGSWMHLLGNMLYLWIFADNIEAKVGNGRFLLFYLIGGWLAGIAQVVVDPSGNVPCVGASGAIAAVMGAYFMMFPGSRIKMLFFVFVFYIPAWIFLGVWAAQQVSSGLGVLGMSGQDAGNVAWWAHIGGFAYGLIRGYTFRKHLQ